MRKNKNNERQDLIRMHKTPSPSGFADMKSPRFHRNVNKAQESSTKAVHKQQQKFDVFKAYLIQLKQRQNTSNDENVDTKQKRNFRQQHVRSPTSPAIDSNPYSLGTPTNSQVQSKIQEKRPRNLESDRQGSRKTSVSRQGSESGQNRNSYQETIRKLANQNIRLRHQCKVMQQKIEKILQQRKNISNENGSLKMEVEKIGKYNEQLAKKDTVLNEEIKNLKKILTVNSEELSQSNYQIYKMKQQIFQLKLTIQKLQAKKRDKSLSNHQKGFNSEKLLQSSTKIDIVPPSCKSCKVLTANISELTTRFQNAKLQVGEKTNTISTLRAQIIKLQGELKLLEKPRILYKKYNSIIVDLNQQIMNEKAKQLSYKYLKIK